MVRSANLQLIKESSSGDYIATVAIGSDYVSRWHQFSEPLWETYCAKHGLGLVSLVEPYEDPGGKRVDWQKLLIGKAFSDAKIESNNICFVDYDLVPSVCATNIFDEVSENTIGFVSQRKGLPYRDINQILRRVAFHRHKSSNGAYPLDSLLTARPEAIFRDYQLFEHQDYGCGGLFVFNTDRHAEFFTRVFYQYTSDDILSANPGEEVYLNHHIQSHPDLEWLDYYWHAQWWYEMAWNHPYLYYRRDSTSVERAIKSVMMKTNFLHFVGSWEKWAWEYSACLQKSDFLDECAELDDYIATELQSPNLGLLFPVSAKDRKMISK